MALIPIFLKELQQEAVTTRKMFSRVPEDRYDWKPHPKSMTIRQLVTHVAELPTWITLTLTTSELDFATNPYQPVPIDNNRELSDYFETSLKEGSDSLEQATEEQLLEPWSLRNGDQIYMTHPKSEVIRVTLNQIVHHRAQLGVFLRMLNIPIPGSYGPSADEMGF